MTAKKNDDRTESAFTAERTEYAQFPAVYAAISAVTADLGKVGIAKVGINEQQKYRFRGIDQVYAVLNPALVRAGLVILPRVIDRSVTERVTPKGGMLFYTVLTVEYSLVAVSDGSIARVVTVGEAMDSGDKSTNKAMSAAFKYMALQAFAIPVEGEDDADRTTHEVAGLVKPDGYDIWLADLDYASEQGIDALRGVFSKGDLAGRSYLMGTDKATYERIVARAKEVSR